MIRLGGYLDLDTIQLLLVLTAVALVWLAAHQSWATLVRWMIAGVAVSAGVTTVMPVVDGSFERDQAGLWLGAGLVLLALAACTVWWLARILWWLLRSRSPVEMRRIRTHAKHLAGGVLAIGVFVAAAYAPVQLRTAWFGDQIISRWALPDREVGGPIRAVHVFRMGFHEADLLVVEGGASEQDPCAGLPVENAACQGWFRRAWYVQLSEQRDRWHLDQATVVWTEGQGNAGGYTLPPYLG